MTMMTAIICSEFGEPDVLTPENRPVPVPADDEVLIKVAAAGINRADILQRKGKYPPPEGASDIIGMEVSGTVEAAGAKVTRWKKGDKVCALLSGGGYATYAVAPADHCLPAPPNMSLRDAAVLPEAIITVYANLFDAAKIKPGETALIHGGSSGIGTTAIQMLKAHGSTVFVTVGNEEKMDACHALGADLAINYHQEDFVPAVLRATDKRGPDVILDMVGGNYVERNLRALNFKGRHVSIATQQNVKAEIDIRQIMSKQLIVTGSTLRGRDKAEKARLVAEVGVRIWPWVLAGKIKPVIFQSFPLKNAAEAHKVTESGAHIGKMLLEISN